MNRTKEKESSSEITKYITKQKEKSVKQRYLYN